jgi:hypothetical protein
LKCRLFTGVLGMLLFTQVDMRFFVLTDTTAGATNIKAEGEGNR